MKIIFKRNIPESIDKPFGIYQYDELLSQNPLYIDIREIVREKSWIWLDEVQSSYTDVSKAFLRYTRWWWVTSMSRLDIRPWWQESLLKPLLFANAVYEWLKSNPDVKEILLIGCDPLVVVYLKEFDKTLILKGERRIPQSLLFIFQAFKQSVLAALKLFSTAYRIGKYYVFKPYTNINFKVIVLHEFISGIPITSGYKYFYGTLFDSIKDMDADFMGYSCIEYIGSNIKEDRKEISKNRSQFFLLDYINILDLLICIFTNIYIILVTWAVALCKIPCSIKGSFSFWFWPNYLFHELGRVPCLNAICAYMALKTLLKQSPQCKLIIYPYEEKGIERAILFACQEHDIRTIGYAPHPQYRSALSLRDNLSPLSPKPSSYAVCGSAYVDYFVSWGKKDLNSISVWGSDKSNRNSTKVHEINRSNLTVLLLISHPNELKIFYSWLRTVRQISYSVIYLVRVYKAVNYRKFERVLTPLMKEFDCVKESQGELDEDLKQCDLAAFCATSAGLIAVNHGYLAIYVDLNEFFEINPCFDDLDVMLPCKSPAELAKRLDDICDMNTDSIMELHHRQLSLVERIFSPIQTSNIKEGILC